MHAGELSMLSTQLICLEMKIQCTDIVVSQRCSSWIIKVVL